jgi:hypothetical protein
MSFWTDIRDTVTAPVRAVGNLAGDVFSGHNVFDSLGHAVKTFAITPLKPLHAVASLTGSNVITKEIEKGQNAIGNAAASPFTFGSQVTQGRNVFGAAGNMLLSDQAGVNYVGSRILSEPVINNAVAKYVPLLGGAIAENEKITYNTGQNQYVSGQDQFKAFRDQAEVGAAVVGAVYGLPALAAATGVSSGQALLAGAALSRGNIAGAVGAVGGPSGLVPDGLLPDGLGDVIDAGTDLYGDLQTAQNYWNKFVPGAAPGPASSGGGPSIYDPTGLSDGGIGSYNLGKADAVTPIIVIAAATLAYLVLSRRHA